jgi:hypothetical protein
MTLVGSKGKRATYMAVLFMGVLTPVLLFTSAANAQKTNAICSNAATAQRGCIAYEHSDFRGRSQALGPNRIFNYVGDAMNDKISSFRVAPGCHVIVWEHRDKGGASERFDECQYIGDEWNDDISCWSCVCR